MRYLFTDGWNSFWHFVLGILSQKYQIILLIFLTYQVVKHSHISDSFAGILEFLIGIMLYRALNTT